jgi:hypothetical protein
MGQGKHIVEIWTREQLCLPGTQPFFLHKCLAFRAMPVPAGVVRILFETTVVTSVTMSSKYGCTTDFNTMPGLLLCRQEVALGIDCEVGPSLWPQLCSFVESALIDQTAPCVLRICLILLPMSDLLVKGIRVTP